MFGKVVMKHTAFIILLLPASFFLLGCDEDLASRDHFELPFSMYGIISPDLDTQSVRVYPMADFPTLVPAEISDLRFSSTDLDAGTRYTWYDSLTIDLDGGHGYLFWSPFQAEYGHRYRVEIERLSDGARSWADVRVPPMVTVRLDDSNAHAMRIFTNGESIRMLKPELQYDVKPAGAPETSSHKFPITHEGSERLTDEGWVIVENMALNRMIVQGLFNSLYHTLMGIRCFMLDLHELEFHALIGDAAWDPPGGYFDIDVLSQPRTLSNVENGLGFVGGGYRIVEYLRPSREAVEEACFNYMW